jgi:predicted O-methyltransferase YrrM
MDKIVRGSARRVLALGAPDVDATSRIQEALASDGTLILMEGNRDRAEEARRRFHSAGLDKRTTVIAGDPRRMLYKLSGPFDAIFCAAAEPAIHEKLAALLAPGGVLITTGRADGV